MDRGSLLSASGGIDAGAEDLLLRVNNQREEVWPQHVNGSLSASVGSHSGATAACPLALKHAGLLLWARRRREGRGPATRQAAVRAHVIGKDCIGPREGQGAGRAAPYSKGGLEDAVFKCPCSRRPGVRDRAGRRRSREKLEDVGSLPMDIVEILPCLQPTANGICLGT